MAAEIALGEQEDRTEPDEVRSNQLPVRREMSRQQWQIAADMQ